MAAKIRLFSIAEVEVRLTRSDPPQLAVTAHGYAVSTGWTDPELVPLEKKLSVDGILDLAFVGTPPASISLPALTPQSAGLVWTDDVDRLVGVRVVSRTNEIVRLVVEETSAATTQPVGEETTQIAGEGMHPHFAAAAAARGGATTMAVGEEGPPPISTMATGEETMFTTTVLGEEGGGLPPTHLLGEHGGGQPPMTTLMLGEEHGGYPPTTEMLGEEGGGYPPTTLMLGEEHGGYPPTTQMLGEEGGGYPPTHLLGEHGGGQGPTTTAPLIEETTQIAGEGQPQISTFPPAEEQSTFAYRRSEAVLMDPKGWQTGRAEATTLAIGEETTQIAGEGQPPHITTELQAEEQGGGGTVFTTLVVGEEGGYGGTTAPLIEETTQVAGEGWHDPQNQNPLGRR